MDSIEYTLLPGRYISPRVRDSNRWTVRMTEMSSTSRWDVVERVGLLSVCHSIWIRHFFLELSRLSILYAFWSFQVFAEHGFKTWVWEWGEHLFVFQVKSFAWSLYSILSGRTFVISRVKNLLNLYTRFGVDERLFVSRVKRLLSWHWYSVTVGEAFARLSSLT